MNNTVWCKQHGPYTSLTGACPICREVTVARALLRRQAAGCSAMHCRARELLEEIDERAAARPWHHCVGEVASSRFGRAA